VPRTLAAAIFLGPLAALADCEAEGALRRAVANDPTTVANAALSRGDVKFLGVAGYAVSVPGVDSQKCRAHRGRVRVLEGTSDTPCDVALQRAALEFAHTYNRVIKANLDAKRIEYATCAP